MKIFDFEKVQQKINLDVSVKEISFTKSHFSDSRKYIFIIFESLRLTHRKNNCIIKALPKSCTEAIVTIFNITSFSLYKRFLHF